MIGRGILLSIIILLQVIPQFPYIIYGYVSDSSGELVDNATVVAKNVRTGENVSTVSKDGAYQIDLSQMKLRRGDEILLEVEAGGASSNYTHVVGDSMINFMNLTIPASIVKKSSESFASNSPMFIGIAIVLAIIVLFLLWRRR